MDVALRHSELFSEINCKKPSRHIPCTFTVSLILGQTLGSHTEPANGVGAQPDAYRNTGIAGSHGQIISAYTTPFPSFLQAIPGHLSKHSPRNLQAISK